MPYQGERASKTSHHDIVKNPDVAQFLGACSYLTPPSVEVAGEIAARFEVPPTFDGVDLPDNVIAIDGSYYESSIDERLPSTKIGYVKAGCVLIQMAHYKSLRVWNGRFVDPFRVAGLQDSNSPITFTLPSANVLWGNKGSVRDSFRAAVDAHLYGPATRFNDSDPATSLRTTLFRLAALRKGDLGTGNPRQLKIHKCPDCGGGPICVEDTHEPQHCVYCNAEVYPSDCLRIWEEVSDYQSNVEALSRFMLAIEHMLAIHYIRYLAENSLSLLSSMAFFIDGPLAIFGNPAWLNSAILSYLANVNDRLISIGKPTLLMVGLQKTGQMVDHVNLIEKFIPHNRIFAIDDDYRYKYVLASRNPAGNGFGSETYYGQDFIYKTASGRAFVFALPYPFASKDDPTVNFIRAKTEMGRYPALPQALALINDFESDLYENAVVPIALAHRYTAISFMPGGRVLDLLTRHAFDEH